MRARRALPPEQETISSVLWLVLSCLVADAWPTSLESVEPPTRLSASNQPLFPLEPPPGLSLVGVEPVQAMRDQFEAALPGVRVIEGGV